jgi:hypothetical protein
MITSRIGKVVVAGIVLGASLLLWPATAGATHQPACPYPHDGGVWAAGPYLKTPGDQFFRPIDKNNNGLLCFNSEGPVKDDVDPDSPDGGAEKEPITALATVDCGGNNVVAGRPVIGFVTISLVGNGPVAAQVSLKDAIPNQTYAFFLIQTPSESLGCNKPPDGSITTNGQGNGNVGLSAAKLPDATGAFVFAFGPEQQPLVVSDHYAFGSNSPG